MPLVRVLAAVLVTLLGVAALALGAGGLWADSRFDGPGRPATVILSGARLLEVQYAVGDRTVRTAIWRGPQQPLIGTTVTVQVADGRPTFARLAGDGRFASYGLAGVAVGAVLVLGLVSLTWRGRRVRRRRSGPAEPVPA